MTEGLTCQAEDSEATRDQNSGKPLACHSLRGEGYTWSPAPGAPEEAGGPECVYQQGDDIGSARGSWEKFTPTALSS